MKKVFAVLFTILAVVGIAQIGGDRQRLSEQGPAQMNSQSLCNCPFIPLAGTEANAPVTGEIFFDNDPSANMIANESASGMFSISETSNGAFQISHIGDFNRSLVFDNDPNSTRIMTQDLTTLEASRLQANSTFAQMYSESGSNALSLDLSATAINIYSNVGNPFQGIVYGDNYSSQFTDRSLVDKAYVDSLINDLRNDIIAAGVPLQ